MLFVISKELELLAVFQIALPVRIARRFIQPGQNICAHLIPIRDCIIYHEV